jgi:UDP-glucose 6-dehydrogenase
MSKEKRHRTTVTVRLTDEEYDVLTRLCDLQKTTRTAYLARVATRHAKQELLRYAADEYLAGRASLSELATRTGLDVPTIMEEIAQITGEDSRAVDSFLSAVETLSQLHNDPEFYAMAKKAIE